MCCFLNRQNHNYFCHCTPCFVPYFWQGELLANGYNQTNTNGIVNQANNQNNSYTHNCCLTNQNGTSLANENFFGQSNCCSGLVNVANAFWLNNGLMQTNSIFGNSTPGRCGYSNYTFANCCRGAKMYPTNFALDRPLSASFLQTPNYHNIVTIGF